MAERLHIRRIPELHVRLDDSAERGTRVLHLLQELEAGVDPDAVTPLNESLPTPVKRLPHEGDSEEPALDDAVAEQAAEGKPAAGAPPSGRRPGPYRTTGAYRAGRGSSGRGPRRGRHGAGRG